MPKDNEPDLLQTGASERAKAAVHYVLGGFAFAAGLYNASAYAARRSPRLAANAVIYLGIAVLEWFQMERHLGSKK